MQAWTINKGHGCIERIRELKDRCSRDCVYAITSLDPAIVGAAALLQLSRDHWQFENSLFHVHDATFREDHCRVRSGSPPRRSPPSATPPST